MHTQFLQAIKWNTINVFLYKFLLQTHQACLFYAVSKELFGTSGTIFSSIYLLISLTNFGFDYSLFSFYHEYSSSQTRFKSLVKQYALRAMVTLLVVACISIVGVFGAEIKIVDFFLRSVPRALLPFLACIFITESLKKSLEVLAQLSFLNKSITILEIGTIVTYLTVVWSSYLIRGSIDLYSIFIPMALTSAFELVLLVKRLYLYYLTLPTCEVSEEQNDTLLFSGSTSDSPTSSSSGLTRGSSIKSSYILTNQAINYVNQVAKAFFSPNFLILFLAYHLGMVRAGYIKLFTDIVILLYMLLNRSVGIPSGALLSKLPRGTLLDQLAIKTTFLKITNAYIQFLYALAATITAAIAPCILKSSCFQPIITTNVLLFIFAAFVEYVVITYEKLYITQHASKYLAMINSVSMLCLGVALYHSTTLPSSLILIPIIVIRFVTVGIIAFVAHRKWFLFPDLKIHFKTLLISLAASSVCLSWHYLL
ncbi:MAG: hypothetical protein NTZ68_03650 [Candidatus Dependentiae bacterium]|nr:hypothetical protein [Candidatus Dependentiae bacterium]